MANKYAPLEQRFWSKVDPCRTDGHAMWLASTRAAGYGVIRSNNRLRSAARVAVELATGQPFPDELEPDHLCREVSCVWHEHIEPVTPRINKLRSNGITARAARATHCPQGHAYDLLNTHFDKLGTRHCRLCNRDRKRQKAAEAELLGRGVK